MNEIMLHGDNYILFRNMGYIDTKHAWIHQDRILSYNVFIFTLSGQLLVIEDGIEYVVKEGEAFFLKKGVHHWGTQHILPGTFVWWVHFYDSPFAENTSRHKLQSLNKYEIYSKNSYNFEYMLPKSCKIKNIQFISSKLKALNDLYISKSLLSQMSLSMNLMDLFIYIYKQSLEKGKSLKSGIVVKQLVSYLEEHYTSGINSTEISELLKLNYNYLSTIFKKVTAMSISEFHMRCRIQKAIEMFKSTANISEVSQAVGYSDPLYFSRVFKKITGESPSCYLKSLYKGYV